MIGGVISIWLATCLCGAPADSPVGSQTPAESPAVTTVIHFGPETDSSAAAAPEKNTILHRLDLRAARARGRLGTLTFQAHEQFDQWMGSDVAQSIIMTIGVAGYVLRGWSCH